MGHRCDSETGDCYCMGCCMGMFVLLVTLIKDNSTRITLGVIFGAVFSHVLTDDSIFEGRNFVPMFIAFLAPENISCRRGGCIPCGSYQRLRGSEKYQ